MVTEFSNTEPVKVETLKPGDRIVYWENERPRRCTVDVTWNKAEMEYWAVSGEEKILLRSQSTVDKIIENKPVEIARVKSKPWWQFWKSS